MNSRVNKLHVPSRQRGITTILIAILLLVILSVVVFFATSVGIFDQRTATNENRARLTQQAAEARLNLGIEYLKANAVNLTNEEAGGWLEPGSEKWVPCTTAAPSGQLDPCLSIRDVNRRNKMYRFVDNGSTALPYAGTLPTGADVTAVTLGAGGATSAITGNVVATLCRFDIEDPALPDCSLDPETPGMISITVASEAEMAAENAKAEAQETVGTFRVIGGAASVPLVASGLVTGLGNAEIVANPNAGGFGVPGSIWSPAQVDIESSGGGGVGSVSTCQMGEFLQGNDIEDLFTACAGNGCGCPSNGYLSGHFGSTAQENIDVLDIDGNQGALPDVTYFPSHKTSPVGGAQLDDPNDDLDDSLFEWIFAQDVVDGTQAATATQPNVLQNCGSGSEDCAMKALESLGAVETDCSDLDADSAGLYWAKNGCAMGGSVIGSVANPVVVVIENDWQVNGNKTIYGMVFVRSSTNTATFRGNGNVTVFGSIIVEGNVNTNGSIRYIYSDKVARNITNSPAFLRFGKIPGSWLDASTSF